MTPCIRGCKLRDQHLVSCLGECRGCLPRHAENVLCEVCERRLPENLNHIIEAWEDLHKQVARSGSYALKDRVTGTPQVGLVLNDHVMDLMTEVRDWALFVARVIADESPAGYPVNPKTDSMLLFIAKNVGFLSVHELAGEFVDDSARLWAKVEKSAYPSGSRRMKIEATCSETVDGQICGGPLFAMIRASDDRTPSAIYCKKNKEHKVETSAWIELGKKLRGMV